MFEIGRLCVKIAGRDAGQKCVVIDSKDNRLLVDGETRRRLCNPSHLEPLAEKLDVKKGASRADVVAAFKKIKIELTDSKPKKAKERPRKVRKTKEKPVKEKKASKAAKPAEKKAEKVVDAKATAVEKPKSEEKPISKPKTEEKPASKAESKPAEKKAESKTDSKAAESKK